MKQYYESEVLFQLMERDGFNIPSSVPPYESEIKAYLINQVKQAYPKLTDYEAEWLLYNYTKHLPAEFPISSVTNVTSATFENVVPFAYQSTILKGNTGYRDIDTGEFLETFEEGRNLELLSVKMPVLTTTGKNLFSGFNNYDTFVNGVYYKENLSKTNPLTSNVYLSSGEYTLTSNYKKATSFEQAIGFSVGDEKFAFLPNSSTAPDEGKISITFTVKNGGYFSFFISTSSGFGLYLSNIQIEKGTTATPYEPYKSNILTVNEEVELRGIGDVKDTLDCLTGEVTQRIGEVVFDGSGDEDWNIANNNDILVDVSRFTLRITDSKTTNAKLITDKFKYNTTSLINDEVCYMGGEKKLYVNIYKNKLSENTIKGFKAWLSQNPLTVQYELATKSVKTVDLKTVNESGESIYFMPLEGTMHVQSSGESIQPTFDMSVPVEATTQNLASFIDLEMGE